jgi:hypothetical protein
VCLTQNVNFLTHFEVLTPSSALPFWQWTGLDLKRKGRNDQGELLFESNRLSKPLFGVAFALGMTLWLSVAGHVGHLG